MYCHLANLPGMFKYSYSTANETVLTAALQPAVEAFERELREKALRGCAPVEGRRRSLAKPSPQLPSDSFFLLPLRRIITASQPRPVPPYSRQPSCTGLSRPRASLHSFQIAGVVESSHARNRNVAHTLHIGLVSSAPTLPVR